MLHRIRSSIAAAPAAGVNVPVGLASVAGYSVTAAGFVAAVVAALTGHGTEHDAQVIVAGAGAVISLVVTSIVRGAQAVRATSPGGGASSSTGEPFPVDPSLLDPALDDPAFGADEPHERAGAESLEALEYALVPAGGALTVEEIATLRAWLEYARQHPGPGR